MRTYEIHRKHSSDSRSAIVEIAPTKGAARKFIRRELDELMRRYPSGHVVKTTNGGIEVYRFGVSDLVITYGFIS